MAVLSINNLSKSYGKVKAVNDLSLTIEKGNVYGLLGPNGSGKTTTLGILLVILKPDSGSYEWFDGEYGENARIHIGGILETPNFYPYLNAEKNLEIVRQIKGAPKQDFMPLLETVNLAHRSKSKFRAYSLGMKQRLAIAATMIGDPQVLIFDEPTNGLDPEGIAEVRHILKRIADMGNTVILASHILNEVEKICDHVAIIKNGVLLATGPVGSILTTDATLEIDSADRSALIALLEQLPEISNITDKGTWIECNTPEGTDITALSSKIYEHGQVPTRLVLRKRALEEEFLAITQQA